MAGVKGKSGRKQLLNRIMIRKIEQGLYDGLTGEAIAKKCSITPDSLWKWVRTGKLHQREGRDSLYARLFERYQMARDWQQEHVEQALYETATGQKVVRKVKMVGASQQIESVEEQQLAPSVEAQKFYLSNVDKRRWGKLEGGNSVSVLNIAPNPPEMDKDAWVAAYLHTGNTQATLEDLEAEVVEEGEINPEDYIDEFEEKEEKSNTVVKRVTR